MLARNFPHQFYKYRTTFMDDFYETTSRALLPLQSPPECIWVVGTDPLPTLHASYPSAFVKHTDDDWDMYRFESTLVVTGVNKSWHHMASALMQWSDRLPFTVRGSKRSFRIRPSRIIVCSDSSKPDDIWGGADATTLRICSRYRVLAAHSLCV
jgi:hypothetical protein